MKKQIKIKLNIFNYIEKTNNADILNFTDTEVLLPYKPGMNENISIGSYYGTVIKIINRYDENIIDVFIQIIK